MRKPLNFTAQITYTGRSIREERGITFRQIESDTHIAKSTICKWEKGSCVPSFQQLAILAKYFDVDWTKLVRVD